MRVSILVLNNATVDSRVLRHAETFARAGHEVVVIATDNGGVPGVEVADGFTIRRVRFSPTWPEKYPRLLRTFGRRPKPPVDESPRPGPRLTPRLASIDDALPGSMKRLSPGEWIRWLRTGTGRPPRSWPGGEPTPRARVAFLMSFPAAFLNVRSQHGVRIRRKVRRVIGRQTMGRVRRGKKHIQRIGRGKLLGPDFLRQLEARIEAETVAFKPDLVWANDAETLGPGSRAAERVGARLAYDAHEAVWDAPHLTPERQSYWTDVERRYIGTADIRYTVCEPIAVELQSRYSIPHPHVILNAPRLHTVVPRAQSPLNAYRNPGEKLVLFHGGFSIHRGLEQLVQAMLMVDEHHRLVLLGYGRLKKPLEEDVELLGIAHRVTFLDAVPPTELLTWVAGADVGVIPYQRIGTNHEYSTPNKLFECMHAGVPVVVNELPEMKRIVLDVGFGIVTDCSDPAAIAKAIEELTTDDARWTAAHEAALRGAKKYSWDAQEAQILEAAGPRA